MAKALDDHLGSCALLSLHGVGEGRGRYPSRDRHRRSGLLAVALLLAPLVFAQGTPQVTGVEPSSGKVNDVVALTGENLGKGTVSAVFLSDEKTNSQATVLEQAEENIVIKVPRVKAGNYNISVQAGYKILIMPVHFKVQ
jgi:hypothetical protein